MEFDEYIKKLGKDILDLSLDVIEKNKGDDEKYYNNLYLKIKDGAKVYIPVRCLNNHNKELAIRNYRWNDKYQRNEGYYIHIMTNSRYGFLVSIDLHYLNRDDIKHTACDKEYNNEELSVDDKNIIKKFLENIHNQFLIVEYDKEKTQQVENYNYEEECKYNKQKYDNVMNKLKESNPDIEVLPSIEVAVNWWVDAIKSKNRVKPFGSEFSDIIYASLLTDERDKQIVEEEQIEVFRNTLTNLLIENLSKGEELILGVGWHLICDAMDEAHISTLRAPYRTSMTVTAENVTVNDGYSYEDIEIYNINEMKLVR